MNPAAGIRVLLIEDEPIVAMLAEDLLDSIGCAVVATAATISEARSAITTVKFDIAMVDINLGGEDGLILVDALKAMAMPYLITTGYDARGLSSNQPDATVLNKPYAIAELEAAICRCTGRL
jgi:DNA-binding response OmpR family regulator